MDSKLGIARDLAAIGFAMDSDSALTAENCRVRFVQAKHPDDPTWRIYVTLKNGNHFDMQLGNNVFAARSHGAG